MTKFSAVYIQIPVIIYYGASNYHGQSATQSEDLADFDWNFQLSKWFNSIYKFLDESFQNGFSQLKGIGVYIHFVMMTTLECPHELRFIEFKHEGTIPS